MKPGLGKELPGVPPDLAETAVSRKGIEHYRSPRHAEYRRTVGARFADTLHGATCHLHPGRFGRVRAPAERPAGPAAEGGQFGRPFPRQRFYRPRGYATKRRRPTRSLGNSVFFSRYVRPEFLKTVRVRGDEFLVIGAFFYPRIGYGKQQCGIGIRVYWNPFMGVNRRRIIQVRADENIFYPEFSIEISPQAHVLPA